MFSSEDKQLATQLNASSDILHSQIYQILFHAGDSDGPKGSTAEEREMEEERRTSVAERTGTLHTIFSLTDPFSASHIYDCPDHSGTKIYTDTQTVSIISRRKGKYAIETS